MTTKKKPKKIEKLKKKHNNLIKNQLINKRKTTKEGIRNENKLESIESVDFSKLFVVDKLAHKNDKKFDELKIENKINNKNDEVNQQIMRNKKFYNTRLKIKEVKETKNEKLLRLMMSFNERGCDKIQTSIAKNQNKHKRIKLSSNEQQKNDLKTQKEHKQNEINEPDKNNLAVNFQKTDIKFINQNFQKNKKNNCKFKSHKNQTNFDRNFDKINHKNDEFSKFEINEKEDNKSSKNKYENLFKTSLNEKSEFNFDLNLWEKAENNNDRSIKFSIIDKDSYLYDDFNSKCNSENEPKIQQNENPKYSPVDFGGQVCTENENTIHQSLNTDNQFACSSDAVEDEGMQQIFHRHYQKVECLDSPKMSSLASSEKIKPNWLPPLANTLQLGEFEEVVMLTVGILYGEAYGVSIKKEIADTYGD